MISFNQKKEGDTKKGVHSCCVVSTDILDRHEHASGVVQDGVEILDRLDSLLDVLAVHADLLADVVPGLLEVIHLVHVQQTRQRSELLPHLDRRRRRGKEQEREMSSSSADSDGIEDSRCRPMLCSYSMGDES
jgi:hypothetical protein